MSYDEYIRSILGYPNNSLYNEENNFNYDGYNDFYRSNNELDPELEDCYPEIYKVVYPMVQKACNENEGPYNRDTVEKLTDEIYYAIEGDNSINININLNNDVKTNPSVNNMNRNTIKQRENSLAKSKIENRESRRQNGNLRDIIKILLLRELLNRPNRPRPPVRPPFPGGPRPPMPGPRPPMYPRTFENDLYEY